jgi:hypothetical protein
VEVTVQYMYAPTLPKADTEGASDECVGSNTPSPSEGCQTVSIVSALKKHQRDPPNPARRVPPNSQASGYHAVSTPMTVRPFLDLSDWLR